MLEKRLRYFDGQFLQELDFRDEQNYHVDRQRRPFKSLTVAGVCEGLTVKPIEANEANLNNDLVTVSPGMAIDARGRQIVLESQRKVKGDGKVLGQQVNLFIAYQEESSDPADSETQGNQEDRRWHEKPHIEAYEESEDPPESAVKLAKLTLEENGNVTVDASVCEYSGVHLPNGNGNGATLRYESNGSESRPILTGDLTVTGNVGIGTTSPETKLHVSGELKVKASHDNTTADIAAFYANNGTQGIGIGSNRLQAIGSAENQDIEVYPKGTGKVKVYGDLQVDKDLTVTGKVGIGTTGPETKLHVSGELKVDASHDNTTAYIAAFYANNGTQGIGIGSNRLQAIGSDEHQDIELYPKGTGKVKVYGDVELKNDTNIIFREQKPRQIITLLEDADKEHSYGIGIQDSTVYFRTALNFAWYKLGEHNDGELAPGGNGTVQMVIKDGQVGIGKVEPEARLHVDGRIKDKTGYLVPVGTIIAKVGPQQLDGWLLCDGQTFETSAYPDLFNLLKYDFGGSGSQFQVPNLYDQFLKPKNKIEYLIKY